MMAQVRGADPAAPEAVTTVRGQVEVATSGGTILSVALEPAEPVPCPQAVEAVRDADWVVLGPGSWFTSVIPHLLVPELCRAVVETRGRVLVVLNLAPQAGETPGFGPADHLAALLEHAPDLRVHTVLADVGTVSDRAALEGAVEAAGACLVVADIATDDGSPRHDPVKLARAFDAVISGGEGPRARRTPYPSVVWCGSGGEEPLLVVLHLVDRHPADDGAGDAARGEAEQGPARHLDGAHREVPEVTEEGLLGRIAGRWGQGGEDPGHGDRGRRHGAVGARLCDPPAVSDVLEPPVQCR